MGNAFMPHKCGGTKNRVLMPLDMSPKEFTLDVPTNGSTASWIIDYSYGEGYDSCVFVVEISAYDETHMVGIEEFNKKVAVNANGYTITLWTEPTYGASYDGTFLHVSLNWENPPQDTIPFTLSVHGGWY
jgi:hypothetical protein